MKKFIQFLATTLLLATISLNAFTTPEVSASERPPINYSLMSERPPINYELMSERPPINYQ